MLLQVIYLPPFSIIENYVLKSTKGHTNDKVNSHIILGVFKALLSLCYEGN